MAQPSVVNYFNTRKRSAVDDSKITRAKKVVLLDSSGLKCEKFHTKPVLHEREAAVVTPNKTFSDFSQDMKAQVVKRKTITAVKKIHSKKIEIIPTNGRIEKLLNIMAKKEKLAESTIPDTKAQKTQDIEVQNIGDNTNEITPATPEKNISQDHSKNFEKEITLEALKQKLSKSSRLNELKASISRFKKLDGELIKAEEKKLETARSPKLASFKNIQLEVELSPQKNLSPEKAYLSPKKDGSVKKNLLNLLSPTKNAVALSSASKQLFSPTKPSLTLPFKYRSLAEIFRSIDTVCQIMFNRKEIITFRKLKPAVEELLKKNLTEKHLAQIKTLYDDAFRFQQQKLKLYGTGTRQEQWELVIIPGMDQEIMTSEVLLERRRKLYNIIIERLKNYHEDFLLNLNPPMHIDKEKITRWHPEFDIERVPDVEPASLPQPPAELKYTTGKEVLERAKVMFNCNTRMEQALLKLKESQEKKSETAENKPLEVESVLKGIPKALLEKVRQKQAAKALMSMTRSADKEKEVLLYSRLPEIVRLTRNLFVAEKKSVLPLDIVLQKLENSYRTYLTKDEMERHLRTISKEAPGWLVFHEIRHNIFLKLSKNADISIVINKLETLLKEKSAS